jgi:hypothetical protein
MLVHSKILYATSLLILVALFFTLFSLVYASVFTYRWLYGSVNIANINLVSIANNPYPLCIGTARTGRNALYYTDFESLPSGWIQKGGLWSITSGFKGNGLQGSDNNQGIGRSSELLYPASLASYSTLWISVKTRLVSGVGWYGLGLVNSAQNRMYTIEIYTGGYVEVWSYNVETGSWYRIAYTSIPNYNPNAWYIIVVRYEYTATALNLYVWVYDTSGKQVAYLTASSTSPNRFIPTYIGPEVDETSADFDDFIISTTDPRYVTFVDIPAPGYRIAIYDNLGNLVNSTVVTSSTALLSIVTDIVVGTGYDGRIVLIYPNGMTCLVTAIPNTDAILGGDTYIFDYRNVSIDTTTNTVTAYIGFGSNRTIGPLFNISIYPGNTRYTYLVLDKTNSVIPSTLNLNISIVNYTNQQTSKIQIINGVVQSSTTSAIALQGSNNYVLIEGYFTTRGQQTTIRLNIVSCSTPDLGVCISIPVTIYLSTV